jgi:hypothetical protein
LLLLTKNIEGVLQLDDPRLLSVDVLSVSFGTLNCNLSSQDGLLFSPEPLNFLLDSGQLFFFYYFVFLIFFVPIIDFDLVELRISSKHVCW